MATSWCPFNTADWVLPGKKVGSLSQFSSGEDKWLLRKKAQEVFLNSPLQEERNFRSDCYGLPAVCDLFACMQLKVDKDKWLYRTPLQMWRNGLLELSCRLSHILELSDCDLPNHCAFQAWLVSLVPLLLSFELVNRNHNLWVKSVKEAWSECDSFLWSPPILETTSQYTGLYQLLQQTLVLKVKYFCIKYVFKLVKFSNICLLALSLVTGF